MSSARSALPQSWNRYTYVYGNPLRYVDPDGMDVKILDDDALKLIRDTVPKDTRSQIVSKDGLIDREALNKIRSDDPNFLALKEMVNSSTITEVGTGKGTTLGGTYYDFDWRSIQQVKADMIKELLKGGNWTKKEAARQADESITQPAGLVGDTKSASESSSGNARVIVTDGTGKAKTIPYEERVATMGHELYVHALLLQQGRPSGHFDRGGPTEAQFRQVEERSKNNFRSGQPAKPTTRSVKPKR